jgi:hypothetical protein
MEVRRLARRRAPLIFTAIALIALVSGCSSSSGDQLVALRFHGHFDFRMDPGDGPEHVFDIDSETTIDRDGKGRSETNGKVYEFHVVPSELDRIGDALADVDWDRLESEFAAKPGENGAFAVTFRGRTVNVDVERLTRDSAVQTETARSFLTAFTAISDVAQSPQQAADERRERARTSRLVKCVESRRALGRCTNRFGP